MKALINAPFLAVVFAVVSCSQELAHEPSKTNAHYSKADLWWKKHLSVCWETPGYATEKEWVKDAIKQSWGKYTALKFSGWGSCGRANIRIKISDDTPSAFAGTIIDGRENGMILNFTYNSETSCFLV